MSSPSSALSSSSSPSLISTSVTSSFCSTYGSPVLNSSARASQMATAGALLARYKSSSVYSMAVYPTGIQKTSGTVSEIADTLLNLPSTPKTAYVWPNFLKVCIHPNGADATVTFTRKSGVRVFHQLEVVHLAELQKLGHDYEKVEKFLTQKFPNVLERWIAQFALKTSPMS